MKGKTILLGVTGGIAAYKAAALTSRLVQQGADVHVILTEAAARFVTPLTFQALSRNAVHTDVLEEKDPRVIAHIDLADRADLVIVAPATANFWPRRPAAWPMTCSRPSSWPRGHRCSLPRR